MRLDADVLAAHADAAALRHRVAGVDGEVDEHLADLIGIGTHRPQLRIARGDELHVLAEHAGEEPLHVGDRMVQVDDVVGDGLVPAEEQQLPGERGAALGRLGDSFHLGARGMALAELSVEELGVRRDDREQVVEVVRDAAREPAHRFHLLRHAKPVLELAPFALRAHHVGGVAHREDAKLLAVEGEERRAHVGEELLAALLAVLLPPLRAGAELVDPHLAKLGRRNAVEARGGRVHVADAPLRVMHEDGVGRRLDQAAVADFGFLEALEQGALVAPQAALLDGALHLERERGVIVDRLRQVVEGADLHRLDGRFQRGVPGDEDHLQLGLEGLQLARQIEPGGAEQVLVHERDVDGKPAGDLERAFGPARDLDVPVRLEQQPPQNVQHHRFVVDDE